MMIFRGVNYEKIRGCIRNYSVSRLRPINARFMELSGGWCAMDIRLLNKEDIDVRVGGVYETGITLLLYKNARVDMAILDNAVGPYNWQRDHKEIKGVVYCGVGIFNPVDAKDGRDPWVWKWDAGAESNTAPFIFIPASKVKIEGKKVKDAFKVRYIEYQDRAISCLAIENKKGDIVYSYGTPS